MYLHEVMASVFAGAVAYNKDDSEEFIFYLGTTDWVIKESVIHRFNIDNYNLPPMIIRKKKSNNLTFFAPSQIDLLSHNWHIKK